MKKCVECAINKLDSEYTKDKNKTDGLSNRCKACHSARNKKRYASKQDYIKQQTSNYYYKNKDTIQEKNKDKPSYSKTHPGYYKEYRKKNLNKYREYINAYSKNRRKNDLEYNTMNIMKAQVYAFLKNKHGKTTEELLGYTHRDFINKIGVVNKGEEIDHKIPITWFKPGTPVSVIWSLDNLHITTCKYNREKHNTFADMVNELYYKTVTQWIKEHRLPLLTTYV